VIVPDWPAPAAVRALSTTRAGGVSTAPYDRLNLGAHVGDDPAAVAENRRRVLAACGHPPGRLATAGQVHGARLVEVDGAGHVEACDGLLTRVPGLPLAVTVADCMPLILVAPGAVAVAHAGWRGTAEGMARHALLELCRVAKVPPQAVVVHLGPCIRACCYAVGPEVAERFPATAVERRAGALHLDLAAAARAQLTAAGLPAAALVDLGECTCCHAEWYYSHRRDGERTGRQWALAALPGGDG
jgi:hypothetical protein